VETVKQLFINFGGLWSGSEWEAFVGRYVWKYKRRWTMRSKFKG